MHRGYLIALLCPDGDECVYYTWKEHEVCLDCVNLEHKEVSTECPEYDTSAMPHADVNNVLTWQNVIDDDDSCDDDF